MKRYDINNVKRQAMQIQKLLAQAQKHGSGPGGTFRQGLRFIVDDDHRSAELYLQLEELWKLIDGLSEDDK